MFFGIVLAQYMYSLEQYLSYRVAIVSKDTPKGAFPV